MNTGEFNTWLRRHQALFPKLNEWLEAQDQRSVILTAWAKALSTCAASHAADATDRMLRGVGPAVEFNDWSTLPAVVIQHCRIMGSGKVERSGDGNYVPGSALKAMRELMREKPPERDAEIARQLSDAIDAMGPGDYERTKRMVRDRIDDLSAPTALRLLNACDARRDSVVPAGNAGDAWEGGNR